METTSRGHSHHRDKLRPLRCQEGDLASHRDLPQENTNKCDTLANSEEGRGPVMEGRPQPSDKCFLELLQEGLAKTLHTWLFYQPTSPQRTHLS